MPTSLKNPNALTINGQTYDGSTAVEAGVQTVANGGTGVTTQAEINKAFMGNLAEGTSDVTDGTEFVSSYASNNGFSAPEAVNDPYRRKFSTVWNYIKGKTDRIYAALSHTHTKSDVGLDKVNNTADSDKSVKYASSAGSVSWANVSDKPAYITGSYSNGVLNLYTN